MRSLFRFRTLLAILWVFQIEVFYFFMNLGFIQWILFLGISSACLFFYKRKIKYSALLFARKLKYFNLKKYRGELSRWAKENDGEAMGKSFASQLEGNLSMQINLAVISIGIFRHYPIFLSTPSTFFLLTLLISPLIILAFKKEILISAVGLYLMMAVTPYAMVLLIQHTGISIFEAFPNDLIYFLNVDTSNLNQTADKLFLFTAPWFVSIILFIILSSVTIRTSLKLVFTVWLKALRSLDPI
jgi:hypothetical protein